MEHALGIPGPAAMEQYSSIKAVEGSYRGAFAELPTIGWK